VLLGEIEVVIYLTGILAKMAESWKAEKSSRLPVQIKQEIDEKFQNTLKYIKGR